MLRNAKLTSIHGGFPFLQYPERFAQEALGQNSKAVHRAYSLKAKGRLPSLASYEKQSAEARVIPFPQAPAPVPPLGQPAQQNG